ncbi:probable peptide/nitrate transporter At3g43790 isoform X2 [Drosophila serrata]|uniref:probable peptide/nitrate transporter At3g43790 isoform X2 n=1 Tax=Drosophila serrata TaxID=7274 RepID=UPI000A1CFA8B|nr:probable peptide/nitrate transporter At3g43790 isoform X2 [Drosophila serrata]
MDVDLALSAMVVIMVVCMILCIYTVTEDYIVAYILILTSCEFTTTSGEKTLLANAAMFGMVSSGLFIGIFADKYGRKFAIQVTLLGSLSFSFISSLMPEVYSMAVMRFILGVFLNGPASLGIGYLMEYYAPKWHALAVSVQVQGVALGLFYNPAMGGPSCQGSTAGGLAAILRSERGASTCG